ncbi:MAG: hypothetical protein ABF258_01945, partial [Flavobacteriales bacterium]
MIEAINIISFDVPFPANYGGVIDVFYKLQTFHKMGVKVHLHCFEYGRGEQSELEKYCESVCYYKRKDHWINLLSSTPFIVKTRVSRKLEKNLLSNDYPILFEGLHTCFLLNNPNFKNRIKLYRESNIEHRYYNHLAKSEKSFKKKLFLLWEARKLKKFESIVNYAQHSFMVSQTDFHYFEMKYPKNNNHFVPSFHSGFEVNVKEGKSDFVLYHGNLSVSENYEAVSHLIKKVFSVIDVKLIVAGLNPPEHLITEIKKADNVTLIANPDDEKMRDLVANAQIHFLYTNQATGLKLKLLNVLYQGRHCLVNSKMVEGTTLAECCIVEDSVDKQIIKIKNLMEEEVSEQIIEKREANLLENYSNEKNFKRIM